MIQGLNITAIVENTAGEVDLLGNRHAFISKIRAKIDDDPRYPTFLLTVRGAGYRFAGR